MCTIEILKGHRTYLAKKLNAYITAAYMHQQNALTLRDLQSIQSLADRPIEAAETLLNAIMEQPDAVSECFLDALKHTEQQHIYNRLVEDRYAGELGMKTRITRFLLHLLRLLL